MQPISAIQAATEQHVYEMLEKRDEDTVDHYADHCETWLDRETVRDLIISIINLDDRRWPFVRADLMVHCPNLAKAFDKIINHVERHRAEFLEEEALMIINAAAEREQR